MVKFEMPPQLAKIQELIDSKIKRERVLIFLSVFAVIFMVWSFTLQGMFDVRVNNAQLALSKLQQDLTKTQAEIAAETQLLANDPNKIKKDQIATVTKQIAEVDGQLQQLGNRLIRAEQLPGALQEVLMKTAKVKLIRAETFPAKELMLSGLSSTGVQTHENANTAITSTATNELSAGVYQHVVQIKVSGSYTEIYQLLLALEQLPWRFYWQSLEYDVKHYPEAEVTLKVYTLSAEEGLLGV